MACGRVFTYATGERIAKVGTELEAQAPHKNGYQNAIELGALTLKERVIREKGDPSSKDSKTDLGETEAL